jgi:hypothetical protein
MADNISPSAAAKNEKKRQASELSLEERTLPKRLASVKPDVTVVVGGIEFFHYAAVLCLKCPFFDRMLSSHMKESIEKRIEFPEKDPDEWLEVYPLLTLEGAEIQKKMEEKFPDGLRILLSIAQKFISWFDFLDRVDLVEKFDEVHTQAWNKFAESHPGHYFSYSTWTTLKNLPCPQFKRLLQENVKKNLMGPTDSDSALEQIQKYVSDDQCGEEMWEYLVSKVRFDKEMLETLDRKTIVESPLFKYVLKLTS